MAKASQRAYGNEATAAKPKRADGDRELYCCEIKPAEDGGYVAEHRYRYKPKKAGNMADCYPCGGDSETFALADKAALIAHVQKL